MKRFLSPLPLAGVLGVAALLALLVYAVAQSGSSHSIDDAIARVLAHCQFILGPEVRAVEAELAAFCGARHVITCASGTDALILPLLAKGIGSAKIEWDAEIYNEIENELIAWRSLENADVVNAGSVRFQKGPMGHGSYVRVAMNYNPPAGKLGATVAQLLGAEPAQLIKQDLRHLKQIMEAGEIPTIDGQTSGRAQIAEAVTQTDAATMEDSEQPNQETAAASTQTA